MGPAKPFRVIQRQPKETVLWQVVHEYLPKLVSFYHQHDRCLPHFIERELESFLACGLPEYGVSHLRCSTCGQSQIVPFSCKSRGLCPSCGGRRMNQTAKNLVDRTLPDVPFRQWVLTFPPPLRYLLSYDAELCSRVLGIFVSTVFSFYSHAAERECGIDRHKAHSGSVTAIQRVGSALQSTLHFHLLALDGVYVEEEVSERPRFYSLPSPSRVDVEQVAWNTCLKVTKLLQKRGQYPGPEPSEDRLMQEHPLLARSIEASIQSLVALGPRLGQRVLRISDVALVTGLGASETPGHGYNLHANTRVPADDRKRLERMCRYILRPAVSNENLSRTQNGQVVYRLKRAWSDGTRAVVFDPLDFMSRLLAIIPPSRSHQVRFHGVLARRSRLRCKIAPRARRSTAPKPHSPAQMSFWKNGRGNEGGSPARVSSLEGRRWIPRSELLAHVFEVDVSRCPRCGRGRMELVSVLTRPEAIRAVLMGMGIMEESLGMRYARGPPTQLSLGMVESVSPKSTAA